MPTCGLKAKERGKRYRERNKELVIQRGRQWNKQNPESCKAARDRYRANNKFKVQASNNARYARKLQAMPIWANDQKELIETVYQQAQLLTQETGIPHEVDHTIPLRGKNVSGLHCYENLQVLTAEDNRRKNNHYACI